jgi:hypothetical protein
MLTARHARAMVMVGARCWRVGRLPLPFALERTCAPLRDRVVMARWRDAARYRSPVRAVMLA